MADKASQGAARPIAHFVFPIRARRHDASMTLEILLCAASDPGRTSAPVSSGMRNGRRRAWEGADQIDSPPSITNACPVMKAERSDARKTTASAISSAAPKRPMGIVSET